MFQYGNQTVTALKRLAPLIYLWYRVAVMQRRRPNPHRVDSAVPRVARFFVKIVRQCLLSAVTVLLSIVSVPPGKLGQGRSKIGIKKLEFRRKLVHGNVLRSYVRRACLTKRGQKQTLSNPWIFENSMTSDQFIRSSSHIISECSEGR